MKFALLAQSRANAVLTSSLLYILVVVMEMFNFYNTFTTKENDLQMCSCKSHLPR